MSASMSKKHDASKSAGTCHRFGGTWTQAKLEILQRYLTAYTLALKDKGFHLVYIDAFAGTGGVDTAAEEEVQPEGLFPTQDVLERRKFHDGSARIALQLDRPFDSYWFVEQNRSRHRELQDTMECEFPNFRERMEFLQGDANEALPRILERHDWRSSRGVVFIDPYGANVDFETLRAISRVPALDVWLLFPLGQAINRLLMKDPRNIPAAWASRLDRVFGTKDWRTAFYKKHTQPMLFGMEEIENKVCDWDTITEFYKKQLEDVFAKVARDAKMLRNSSNIPLFAFIFAMSNPSPKAQGLALRIANYILKSD